MLVKIVDYFFFPVRYASWNNWSQSFAHIFTHFVSSIWREVTTFLATLTARQIVYGPREKVARVSEVINVYWILGSKSEMSGHLGELSVDGDIILKLS